MVDLELLPGDVIGYMPSGTPIRLVAGGADDDDDAGDGLDLEGGKPAGKKPAADADLDDDDDDSADDDAADDTAAAKKPAGQTYTEDDVAKLKASLTAARKESRDAKAALRKGLADAKTTQKAGSDDDTVAAAKEEATAAAVAKFKPVAVRAAAKAAFLEANFQNPTDARVSRLVRNLDMDAIEIDEDGVISGLDEQVEALVEEFEEMFTVPAAKAEPVKPKPPRGDTADKRTNPPAPKTTAERIAQRVLNSQS